MEKIVRIGTIISMIWALGLVIASPGLASACASSTAMSLEMKEGERSFIVDPAKANAWWNVDEYGHKTPVQKTKSTINTISSEKIIEQVTLGNHQVMLKQMFRFNMADTPNDDLATTEVYNSIRGGWSLVPVRFNANRAYTTTCQTRLEVPKC